MKRVINSKTYRDMSSRCGPEKPIWRALIVFAFALSVVSPAIGDVTAGVDLLTTPGGETFEDFAGNPIPAGFFGPGSDAFTANVPLVGVPLVDLPLGIAQGADTIVERLQTAVFSGCPSLDTVGIEIVALRLRSLDPITVTFHGGNGVCTGAGAPNACCTGAGAGDCESEWQLDVALSSSVAQAVGSMQFQENCAEGGSFNSDLPVRPKLVFTKVSGTLGTHSAVLDPAPQIDFNATGCWSYTSGLEGIYRDSDASLTVSAGDTRLSVPGAPVVGSAVASGEADLGATLSLFTVAERHVDPIANGTYDPGEGIYRDVDLSNAISVGDVRLSVRTFATGSVVAGGDPDIATALAAFTGAERYRDADTSGAYDDGEGIYNDADSSSTASLGDSRLLGSLPGFPLGSVVAAGNVDDGTGLVAFNFEDPSLCTSGGIPFTCCTGVGIHDGTCNREMHVDPNTNGTYDVGEGVYRDRDADHSVSAGDSRITVIGFSELGSVVAGSDSDVGDALIAFASTERHADPDGNGQYDSGLGSRISPGGFVDGDADQLIDEAVAATGNIVVGVAPIPCNCGSSGGFGYAFCETKEEAPQHSHCVGTICEVLAVTLASFTADVDRGGFTLRWVTEAEIDNEGFNMHRSTDPRQPGKVVNNHLIPAEGGPAFGMSYEWVDDSVRPGVTYYYTLEDISASGVSTLHGADACTLKPGVKCEPLSVTINPSGQLRSRQ